MAEKDNYYVLLKVPKDASVEVIKKSYRQKAKKYHPDNSETGNEKKFILIRQAYETLSNDLSRKNYDEIIDQEYNRTTYKQKSEYNKKHHSTQTKNNNQGNTEENTQRNNQGNNRGNTYENTQENSRKTYNYTNDNTYTKSKEKDEMDGFDKFFIIQLLYNSFAFLSIFIFLANWVLIFPILSMIYSAIYIKIAETTIRKRRWGSQILASIFIIIVYGFTV